MAFTLVRDFSLYVAKVDVAKSSAPFQVLENILTTNIVPDHFNEAFPFSAIADQQSEPSYCAAEQPQTSRSSERNRQNIQGMCASLTGQLLSCGVTTNVVESVVEYSEELVKCNQVFQMTF